MTFAERSAQLIADFQHAMDDNAPVNAVLMAELKALLGMGCQAHTDRDAMKAKMAARAATAHVAAQKAQALQAAAAELADTIATEGMIL